MNRKKLAMEFANSLGFPEIKKIILFGSVARGDDNEESDIDILIVSTKKSETKDKIMAKITDALLDREIYISAKVISQNEYENLKTSYFISNINKEGVVIG
ncbi:MAG: nucleotidyltransferase domain-containing protein [Methanobacteriaceae archaeon]|nr:nucleotidyltransferase domain-containing protein [Methanobacteriaceae archaeon]MDP2835798.1 nucleotidyltransferase domain-containing protein [Methanobacteriaceae archaeon]MDP3034592.1 nucleotidyltransferase domain-containing protein [Methanobacteriaceae archaeon]MDP3485205.1 nucleotidyltransferase domain-containing protein [Methanobacteriaceae archaeon]